ncbi:MAG TPA: ABC transporter permease [Treponemataceae bacterium]|nr:ABC transporter permease [Treponemataceae bacterium]
MHIISIIGEAADSLASNVRKALLAALGLTVGVAAVVCVLAAGQGLKSVIVKEMGSFGRPTHLQIYPNWRYLSATGWKTRAELVTPEDREAIASMTDLVAGVSPFTEFRFTARSRGAKSLARIVCVSAEYFPMERLVLERGRMFNAEDDRTKRRAAILGANIATKFFGSPASASYQDPVGQKITIGDFGEVEVIGVLKPEPPSLMASFNSYDSTNNGTIFVPHSAVTRFGGNADTWDLMAEAASEEVVERAERAILSVLKQNHGTWDGENKFLIESGKSALGEVSTMTGLVTTFIAVVAGLSLVVAGIGVMNVMLISVKERTREIGTRKAIGARGSWIGRQFLIESLAVCLSGGIAGVILATAIAFAVSKAIGIPALVPPHTLTLSLALSFSVALVFGWLPARRASSLDPCEALRYE